MRHLAKGRIVVVCDGTLASLSAFYVHLAKMGIDPKRLGADEESVFQRLVDPLVGPN